MSSTKEIRIRIKAIGSTAKITKAMEMVAASKMKKAQDSTVKNRPYSDATFEVLHALKRDEVSHPLLGSKEKKATKSLLILISSDKGLCGSFNTAVIKKAAEYLKENPETDIVTIGKKGQNLMNRLGKNIVATFVNFPVHPHIKDISPIIITASDGFKKDDYKEVVVCYTEFESTLRQVPTLKTLLPLGGDIDASETEKPKDITIKFEPNRKEVIDYLLPRILETELFQMVLESIASEHSARMVAMKNATDSANDLIGDLNLTYNSIRQSSITQELAEISAATNAAAN